MTEKQVVLTTALFLLSHTVSRVLTQQCTKGGSEASILGWKLQGHVYKTMMANFGFECLFICRKDNRCQSFNWVLSVNMCEFSDRTKEARPEDFVPDPDRYYYIRDMSRAPLGSIPELSAETCREIKGSEEQVVSKKYWLSGIKPGVPVLAYCDMETEEKYKFNATFTCDNFMELFADDIRLGQKTTDWWTPFIYNVPGETRVISVKGRDTGGGYYGILGSTSNGLVTNETWKCSSVFQQGWTSPDFDDQGWNSARVVGDHGDGPWGRIDGIAETAKWIWANDYNTTVYCRLKLQ